MNLYLKIKDLLTEDKKYRNDDKELIWRLWEDEGTVVNNMLTKSQFFSGVCVETVRRTRQKVQENHKELQADQSVLERREEKEKLGGHFVWNNQKKTYSKEFLEDAIQILLRSYEDAKKRGDNEEMERIKIKGKQYRKMLDDLNTEFVSNLFKGN